MRRFESYRPNQMQVANPVAIQNKSHSVPQTASSFEDAFFRSQETYVHPTAIIGAHVTLGNGVKIGPYCTVVGNVSLGDNTKLSAYVTIGLPAQDVGTKVSMGRILIGKNCHLREFVTVHAPKIDEGITQIGDECYLMNYSHVAHDVTLEDGVVLINNVLVGGHAHIEDRAMLMAGAAVHQHCRVGRYTSIAPFSGLRQDAPPFCLFSGGPAGFAGLNRVGLKRAGFTSVDMSAIKSVAKWYFQDKILLEALKGRVAAETWAANRYVQEFISFIESSKRGVSRRTASYE